MFERVTFAVIVKDHEEFEKRWAEWLKEHRERVSNISKPVRRQAFGGGIRYEWDCDLHMPH